MEDSLVGLSRNWRSRCVPVTSSSGSADYFYRSLCRVLMCSQLAMEILSLSCNPTRFYSIGNQVNSTELLYDFIAHVHVSFCSRNNIEPRTNSHGKLVTGKSWIPMRFLNFWCQSFFNKARFLSVNEQRADRLSSIHIRRIFGARSASGEQILASSDPYDNSPLSAVVCCTALPKLRAHRTVVVAARV